MLERRVQLEKKMKNITFPNMLKVNKLHRLKGLYHSSVKLFIDFLEHTAREQLWKIILSTGSVSKSEINRDQEHGRRSECSPRARQAWWAKPTTMIQSFQGAEILYLMRSDFEELSEHFTKRAVSSRKSMNNFTLLWYGPLKTFSS